MALSDLPKIINTRADLERLVAAVYEHGNAYTIDFETLGTRVARLRVTGFGIAWGPGENDGAYVVTYHASEPYLPWADALEVIKPLIEDESMTMITHNMVFDATILDYHGVKLHRNNYDTMVMAWLLNTDTPNGLKGLIERRYGYKMQELVDMVPKGVVSWHPGKIYRLDQAKLEDLANYGFDDVRWTYRLWQDALVTIKADEDLWRIYTELYQEFLLVLVGMMSDGVVLDVDYLQERERVTQAELDSLVIDLMQDRPGEDFPGEWCADWTAVDIDTQRKVIPELQEKWRDRNTLRPLLYEHPTLAHKIYNLDSPAQLNKVLFDDMGLKPIGERGKNGHYSTDHKNMTKLRLRDESGYIAKFMRYKLLVKIQGTFLRGLQELVDDDNRIRSSFNPTMRTGRLSSSQPNLQTIPARTDEGRLVRKAFTARPGFTLIVSDYSQAELRVVAHMSGDAVMQEGFRRGADPHSITAKVAFGLECDVLEIPEKHPMERNAAKTLNFGILYGLGAAGVAENIMDATNGEIIITEEQAQELRQNVLGGMPGVGKWIKAQEHLARTTGVVKTITGRPRHLPAAQIPPSRGRGRGDNAAYYTAMRQSVNSPIQSGAADIINIAMRNMRRRFIDSGDWRKNIYLVLQVHDELIFEVREDLVDKFMPIIKEEMEQAVILDVPMLAEPGSGPTWYDAKG